MRIPRPRAKPNPVDVLAAGGAIAIGVGLYTLAAWLGWVFLGVVLLAVALAYAGPGR